MIIPVTKTDLFDIANTATAPANNKHKPASISGLLAFCRSFIVFSYFLVNVINRKLFCQTFTTGQFLLILSLIILPSI